ncbi:MAG: hypothetical protein B0D92_01810 [Spirochaeta sp. LUC14_002_19_P3]|nr:MAG: hypothetical protein B0D92_01810 [Spirochaeta sp. LUC14_002_19_P3]
MLKHNHIVRLLCLSLLIPGFLGAGTIHVLSPGDTLYSLARQYGVKLGGKKGNVGLMSFDGRYKVQIKRHEHITFDERIEAAKQLIDNCLNRWTEGSRPEIKALVERAFRTNRQGQLRTAEVLGLKDLDIDDEEWQRAMAALMDSITVAGSTSYINLYERVGETDQWRHISLDLASL